MTEKLEEALVKAERTLRAIGESDAWAAPIAPVKARDADDENVRDERMNMLLEAADAAREALTAWNTRPSVVDEDAIILAMCRAHDREEAAQMGEPSPWREDFDSDPDWEQNRFLAMREAFDEARALLSASTVEG
jgi:hypothetical protein